MSNMPQDFNTFNPNANQFSPPPKSNKTLWIILGVIGGVLLLCCGGFTALSYFGAKAVSGLVGAAAMEMAKTSPELEAELGEIESASMNISETQKQKKAVFDVKGTKGSGQVILEENPDKNGPPNAVLQTSDGRTVPLTFPDFEAPNVELPAPGDEEPAVEAEPATELETNTELEPAKE